MNLMVKKVGKTLVLVDDKDERLVSRANASVAWPEKGRPGYILAAVQEAAPAFRVRVVAGRALDDLWAAIELAAAYRILWRAERCLYDESAPEYLTQVYRLARMRSQRPALPVWTPAPAADLSLAMDALKRRLKNRSLVVPSDTADEVRAEVEWLTGADYELAAEEIKAAKRPALKALLQLLLAWEVYRYEPEAPLPDVEVRDEVMGI